MVDKRHVRFDLFQRYLHNGYILDNNKMVAYKSFEIISCKVIIGQNQKN